MVAPTERFDYWEGDVGPEDIHDDSIGIIMNANISVTAHFKPDVTLTLAKQGVGALNPEEGVHTYIRDETESVVASPADGFDHWEGDLEENDDPNSPMQIVDNEGTDPRRGPAEGEGNRLLTVIRRPVRLALSFRTTKAIAARHSTEGNNMAQAECA